MTQRIFYGWWIVLSCFMIAFYVGGINFYGFTAFIEPLVKDFGWSYTQISFAASLRGLEMGFLAPLIGFLADRFGSRKLILIGILTVGFGMILLSNTHSLGVFYTAILLIAMGAGGCTSVVTMTAIANWFDRDVGKAFGVASSGFGASGLMVPLMVRLIDTYTWRTASIIFAIGTWIVGIPLSLIIRDTPEQYGYLPDGRRSGDVSPMTGSRDEHAKIGFIQVLKKKSFLCVLSAESLRMMALTAVSVHVMPYLGHLGWTRTAAGLVAAGIPIFSIFGRFGFGWIGDVYDKRYVMALAFGMMGIGLVAFSRAEVFWMILIFIFFFPIGFGANMVMRGAILREYFGRELFGRMVGTVMGFASLGGIVGPTLAGWVFDTFGNYSLIWLVFCGVTSLSILLILSIRPEIGG